MSQSVNIADDRQPTAVTLRAYAAILRRRAVLVVLTFATIPAIAVALSLQQHPEYEALAQVLVRREDLGRTLTGTSDPQATQDPQRDLMTQAAVATSPAVVRGAAAFAAISSQRSGAMVNSGSVEPDNERDILNFTVRDREPDAAVRFAGAWARAYADETGRLRTADLETARSNLQTQINQLDRGAVQERTLDDLRSQLALVQTLIGLGTNGAVVLEVPTAAHQVAPRPLRAAVSGLLLAIPLAVMLAVLVDVLDTRIRRFEDVALELDAPVLARLPELKAHAGDSRLVMLNGHMVGQPRHEMVEALRMLRTSVDFATLEEGVPVLMFTSALPREGKSTTIVNLAAAEARAGRRVALLDLDLRNPIVHQLFGLPLRPGLTDVALKRAELDDALRSFAHQLGDGSSAGTADFQGVLSILPAGVRPPDPGDFLATTALAAIIDELKSMYDLILIDTAPMLPVNDAVTLSAQVTGIVVVTKLSAARRPVIRELKRRLEACAPRWIGVVVIGKSQRIADHAYRGYDEADGDSQRPVTARLLRR